jgi:hypothetical protein
MINMLKWMSLNQLLADGKYPFTRGQMRSFMMAKNTNGLNKVIRKIGKIVYFRIDLFEEWIESHKG